MKYSGRTKCSIATCLNSDRRGRGGQAVLAAADDDGDRCLPEPRSGTPVALPTARGPPHGASGCATCVTRPTCSPTLAAVDDEVVVSLGSASVVSAVPGRLRIRVARGRSAAGELDRVERALDTIGEVTEVAVRPHARSVVAHFDPRDAAAVTDRLQALGIAPVTDAAGRWGDPAVVVRDAAGVVNGAVARRVPHGDLRTLVPLGLGLVSVRQALRGPDRLRDAPWYLLAWYASETFFRFHGEPEKQRPAKREKEN